MIHFSSSFSTCIWTIYISGPDACLVCEMKPSQSLRPPLVKDPRNVAQAATAALETRWTALGGAHQRLVLSLPLYRILSLFLTLTLVWCL